MASIIDTTTAAPSTKVDVKTLLDIAMQSQTLVSLGISFALSVFLTIVSTCCLKRYLNKRIRAQQNELLDIQDRLREGGGKGAPKGKGKGNNNKDSDEDGGGSGSDDDEPNYDEPMKKDKFSDDEDFSDKGSFDDESDGSFGKVVEKVKKSKKVKALPTMPGLPDIMEPPSKKKKKDKSTKDKKDKKKKKLNADGSTKYDAKQISYQDENGLMRTFKSKTMLTSNVSDDDDGNFRSFHRSRSVIIDQSHMSDDSWGRGGGGGGALW